MLTLALETSSLAGSVALLDRDNLVSQRPLPADRRSAQTLAPAIDRLLKDSARQPADLRLIAVTVGPGSFTGLRVGVTTAKTLAYAVGADVLGIDTLEAIAAQTPIAMLDSGYQVHAILDAQRKELYQAQFLASDTLAVLDGDEATVRTHRDAHGLIELIRLECSQQILPVTAWLQALQNGALVTGSGLRSIMSELPANVVVVPTEHWEPTAATVGRLAWRHYERGRRDDLWRLAPKYLRASAAEEKAAGSKRAGGQSPPA